MTKLLQNRENLIKDCPKEAILFHNGPIQQKYEPLVESGFLKAFQGPATADQISQYGRNSLLIFDDQPISSSGYCMEELFNIFSHHSRLGILYLVHDLYQPKFRKIRQGAHVFVMTTDLRNLNHAQNLSRELFCYEKNLLMRILKTLVEKSKYDYLIINLQVKIALFKKVCAPTLTRLYCRQTVIINREFKADLFHLI